LTYVCIEEIKRFGMRSSCRITDIMHMVERIAASGVRSEMFSLLQQEAAKCLKSKGGNSTSSDIDLVQNGVLDALEQGDFELHSERPLLWIWRFSTRQRKQQAFLRSASKHWEMSDDNNNAERNKNVGTNVNTRGMISKWDSIFDDPTLPLVLDIGCGMGISVLGLASCTHSKDDNSPHFEYENSVLDLEWSTCNFLGADLSQLAINYASSVSRRWDLKGRVQFEVVSAEEIIENIIATYPGPVKLAMIQFPTPFSFQQDESGENNKEEVLNSVVNQGNKQLPSSAYSGFMVTKVLLDLIYSAVEGSGGKLLLQSNCEDVAVLMKNIAVKEAGFQTVDVKNHTSHLNDKKTGLTKRTEKWIAMGGERAEGSCWSSTHILPIRGSTETETACVLNGTPVHRCVLEVPKNK
jgi:SAM-dependent methyltransferase